jgi:hypothetical protein
MGGSHLWMFKHAPGELFASEASDDAVHDISVAGGGADACKLEPAIVGDIGLIAATGQSSKTGIHYGCRQERETGARQGRRTRRMREALQNVTQGQVCKDRYPRKDVLNVMQGKVAEAQKGKRTQKRQTRGRVGRYNAETCVW